MVPFFVIFVVCLRFWGAAILGLRLRGGVEVDVDVDVGVGRDYVLVSVILGALVMLVMQMQLMRRRRRMRNPISMPFCFLLDLSGRKGRRTKG